MLAEKRQMLKRCVLIILASEQPFKMYMCQFKMIWPTNETLPKSLLSSRADVLPLIRAFGRSEYVLVNSF